MAQKSSGRRVSRELRQSQINLVSARSLQNAENVSYSRAARGDGYATQRRKRARNRRVLTGIMVVLVGLLMAGVTSAFGLMFYFNNVLSTDSEGNKLDMETLSTVLADRARPEDPFWLLLVGTDDAFEGEVSRSDTIILAHIDPGAKKAALVSIPRDTKVTLPGYGTAKINAAYAYGQMELDSGHSGPEFCVDAVSSLTGAHISGYAQVDFSGFEEVVDALGGVEVDVPLDIVGDRDAGPYDVYAGEQVLDGAHALVFVRSRNYTIGDFQRQANQRTFLQALAKQVLSQDPLAIVNTVTKIADMTTTSLSITDIASVANSMRGMRESDIFTYSIPSDLAMIDNISYVVVDQYQTRQLIAALDAGEYPDYSEQTFQGEVPEGYKPRDVGTATDLLADQASSIDTSLYSVTVRNGYAIPGSAASVSAMLELAGYQNMGYENANSFVYKDTLIIYRDDSDRPAAEDIRARLGYGRVIPSMGRYAYEGNILVVVGGDFVP
ncbi:MAG: LCP family protein [Coriobacteriales bacterium]|jgi:LCP family protein required for cell wall assembly|nr:LCP family protein [Coriobacteriales bacterium]